MTAKTLILGATGQVGYELHRQLSPTVPQSRLLTPSRQQLDLTDLSAVEHYLNREQPGLILNAAAYTAVDKAESEPELARRLNADLPKLLAQYSQANNAQLVHYSSDYVYNGTGTQPWQETDPTEPLNHYGQTKLEGDQAIQQQCGSYLILRTSWVYSNRGHNFLNTMLRLAQERTELTIVNDQHGAPTPAQFIAQTTLELLNIQAPPGIYHLAAAGETTWFGFAEAIFGRKPSPDPSPQPSRSVRPPGGRGSNFSPLPPGEGPGVRAEVRAEVRATPTTTQNYPTPAKRPLNSRLNLAKIERTLGQTTPHWEDLLQQTLKDREA